MNSKGFFIIIFSKGLIEGTFYFNSLIVTEIENGAKKGFQSLSFMCSCPLSHGITHSNNIINNNLYTNLPVKHKVFQNLCYSEFSPKVFEFSRKEQSHIC
uniref:Uncharacterized protein n=1 Tax=Cacopsylla melanoneura TaxID=428564 RepID=A0A8D8R4Q6_9HEMI